MIRTIINISDKIVIFICDKNGQIFCPIREKCTKISHKKRKIVVAAGITLSTVLGISQKAEAIGVPFIVRSTSEIHGPAPKHSHQYASTVDQRSNKIDFMIYCMPNKEAIPLIYLNAKNVYINERVLKRLRSGGLEEGLILMAIGVIVFLTCHLSGIDAFTILDHLGHYNAPTTGYPLLPGLRPDGTSKPIIRKESTQLQLYAPNHTQASTFVHADGTPNLDLAYREALRRARYSENFECSFDRFKELAAEDGETTTDSMRAAISALQLEADGVVSNVRRDPVTKQNGIKAFDFLADGPNGTTHLEIKGPVGSEIRKTAGLGSSIAKQGKQIGYKTKSQLNYWFNPTTDTSGVTQPLSRDKVFVAADLYDVPVPEKSEMENAVEYGLKGSHPVLFINNIINR